MSVQKPQIIKLMGCDFDDKKKLYLNAVYTPSKFKYITVKNVIFRNITNDQKVLMSSMWQRKFAGVSTITEYDVQELEEKDVLSPPLEQICFQIQSAKIDINSDNIIVPNFMNEIPLYRKMDYFVQYEDKYMFVKPIYTENAFEPAMIGPETKIKFSLHPTLKINLTGSNIEQEQIANEYILGINDLKNLGIGGCEEQLDQIRREFFIPRLMPQHIIKKYGFKPVKGLMLYGPPGCGKTLIARKIADVLHSVKPVIISGSEMKNVYVGKSEENIRNLFEPAEKDALENGTNAKLHVVIIDEIDAITKQRTGENHELTDGIVNQLLAKMDGVQGIDNIVLIGMTNRLDLIDTALLRPGRFELQIKIGLPDLKGRKEIFDIHSKRFGQIDSQYFALRTPNFSGADIEGLIKKATSYCQERMLVNNKINEDMFKFSDDDLKLVLGTYKPITQKLDDNDAYFETVSESDMSEYVIQDKNETNIRRILFDNLPDAVGLVRRLQKEGYDFIKIIQGKHMLERPKITYLTQIFKAASEVDKSVILIESLEDVVQMFGYDFQRDLMNTLRTLMRRQMKGDLIVVAVSETKSSAFDFIK